jgi:hypothetical protein
MTPTFATDLLAFISDDPTGLDFAPLAAHLHCAPTFEAVTDALRAVAGSEAA